MQRAEGMILGRTTYDGFAAVWPAVPDDQGGREMNGMRKYVASRTRTEFAWNNSTALLANQAPTWWRRSASSRPADGGDLMVVGSCSVFNTLLAAGLVDEIRLLVYPVVLRGSLPLFTGARAHRPDADRQPGVRGGVLALTYTTKPCTCTTGF